jgi:hypothetical protein
MRTHVIAQATGHLPDAASHIVQWTEVVSIRISNVSAKDIQEELGDSHSPVDLTYRLTKLLDVLPALEGPPPKLIAHRYSPGPTLWGPTTPPGTGSGRQRRSCCCRTRFCDHRREATAELVPPRLAS